MRPQGNPLDLNNLPEEFGREGKQVLEESSTTGTDALDTTRCRRKKSSGKDGIEEYGKVYECRFCSLKFCKSQALGGHMNRHRQERETETLYRARQLVFSNENLAAQGVPHLGLRDLQMAGAQSIPSGSFQPSGNMGDPSLPLTRTVYPARLFPGSSSSSILSSQQPPPPPYLYSSSSRVVSYPSQPLNDYFVGHVLAGNSHRRSNQNYPGGPAESSYACIGTPLGHGFLPEDGAMIRGTDLSASASGGGGGDGSLRNQEEGLNWGGSYVGTQQRLDPSPINRFQDGFYD